MKTTITDQQIKAIHKIVSVLRWTRHYYERWMFCRYNVNSCLAINSDQAAEAIAELRALEAEMMITAKQISYIKYLWLSVDYADCAQGDHLLNNFLQHKFGASSVEKLTRKQAHGCIAAIKQMQRRQSAIKIDTAGPVQWITLADGSRVPAMTNQNLQ